MSRRHKIEETENIYKPQLVESHEDGHSKKSRWSLGSSSFLDKYFTVVKLDKGDPFSLEKIIRDICKAFTMAAIDNKIEVDDKWVKIPRSFFENAANLEKAVNLSNVDEEVREQSTHRRGRKFLSRLINTVADSKLVKYVKDTYKAGKKYCNELIENTTQFCTCCLKGIFQFFAPKDDPYGKLSHYHSMLEPEFPDLKSRRTMSNYYKWFVQWSPPLTSYVGPKEKKKAYRYSQWKKLIEWICNHLQEIAPQYALA